MNDANKSKKLQKNVEEFLRLQKRKRIISQDRDQTIIKMAESCKAVEVDAAKQVLEEIQKSPWADPNIAQEVSRIYLEAVAGLAGLNGARRLFALETIDFLGSLQSLKVTAETTIFSTQEQLVKLAWNFLKAFLGTDQVIATLLATDELFQAKTIDSQKFSLNSFRFDLACKIMALFEPSYVKAKAKEVQIEEELTLDLLREILSKTGASEMKANLAQGERMHLALAEVIAYTQAHKMMPVYAKKRYDFLKFFLRDLTTKGKIPGVKPAHMSKVVACFLYANEQLKPGRKLIAQMTNDKVFDAVATQEDLVKFLNNLAPTTMDALLKDVRDFISQLLSNPKRDIQDLFAEAQARKKAGKADDSLFGRFLSAMNELKEVGIMAINTVSEFVTEVMDHYQDAKDKGEVKALDEIFNEIPEDINSIEELRPLAKNPLCLERLKGYRLVQTNVAGVRGERTEGGKRAFAANLQLFKTSTNIKTLKFAVRALFDYLKQSGDAAVVINDFKHPQAPRNAVKEYYTSFLMPAKENETPLLFCLGIGYFEKDTAGAGLEEGMELAETYMDPYAFLMSTSNDNTVMNSRSRKLANKEGKLKGIEFKALNLRLEQFTKICLEGLLDVLHLIPFNQWETKEVQDAVRILYDALGLTPDERPTVKSVQEDKSANLSDTVDSAIRELEF